MSAPAVPAAAGKWPADVLAFAAEHKVDACLEPFLEVTRSVFPSAHAVRVFLDEDPEIPDDRHVVFEVRVPASDVPAYVEARHQWHRETARWCPAHRICVFRLSLLPVPA